MAEALACSEANALSQETGLQGLLAVGEKEMRQQRAAVTLQELASRKDTVLWKTHSLSEASIKYKPPKAELPFIKELKLM